MYVLILVLCMLLYWHGNGVLGYNGAIINVINIVTPVIFLHLQVRISVARNATVIYICYYATLCISITIYIILPTCCTYLNFD